MRVRCKDQGVHEGIRLHRDAPECWYRLDAAGVRYTPAEVVDVPQWERERERERGPRVTRYRAADVQYTLMGPGKYRGRTEDTDTQEMNLPVQISACSCGVPDE